MTRFLLTSFISLLSFIFSAGQSKTSSKKKTVRVTKHTERKAKGSPTAVYYGIAGYYADKFTGRKTATGASYSHKGLTAACNVLPLGTWVKVTNLNNNKHLIVQINDRLHKKNNRIVDLTKTGADKLGYTKKGLAKVKVEVLDKDDLEDEQLN